MTRFTFAFVALVTTGALVACGPSTQQLVPHNIITSIDGHARRALSTSEISALAAAFTKGRPVKDGTRIYLRSDLDAQARITSGTGKLSGVHGALDLVPPGAAAPHNSTLFYTFGSSGRQLMANEGGCADCDTGGTQPAPSPTPSDGCPQSPGSAVGPIAAYNVDPMARTIGTAITNKYSSAHVNYQIVLWRTPGFGQSIFGEFDITSPDISFDVSTVGYDAFYATSISLTITNNNPPPPDIGPQPQDSQTGTTSTSCS